VTVGSDTFVIMGATERDQAKGRPRCLASGATALTVELGETVERDLSAAVVDLAARISDAGTPGLVEIVPTFRSLLVHYDPLVTSAAELSERIAALLDRDATDRGESRRWRIPACYEGELAPDLEEVAERCGLSTAQVVEQHAAGDYHVYMLGFLPGYPYLGDLPASLQLPRRETPRVRVPAGSVAVATNLTAIYTYESPGGWHLIGRTPVSIFDVLDDPPALLRPGDRVGFEPISRAAYDRVAAEVAKGVFELSAAAMT
jgi:KipI family sensor histidine kinase inhibitor